ncbi:hypothetical protein, partial [Zoogloea sp.]|uniref:hypothetical protein n=1 Tax=Zoogloea sp. TaxID=49181 RepID=UPI0025FBF6D1
MNLRRRTHCRLRSSLRRGAATVLAAAAVLAWRGRGRDGAAFAAAAGYGAFALTDWQLDVPGFAFAAATLAALLAPPGGSQPIAEESSHAGAPRQRGHTAG